MTSAVSAVARSEEPAQGHPRRSQRRTSLREEFVATRPNEKWAGDITYVPTRQGWLYVAVLTDLYSRRVLWWAMAAQQTTTLTLTALEMALRHRRVSAGLLHHAD